MDCVFVSGDVGEAMSWLLSQLMAKEDPAVLDESSLDLEMMKEAKEDEKMALESIYADAFHEKIPGRVWEIKLKIPSLLKYCQKTDQQLKKERESKQKAQDMKNVCQFFLRGHCKFGRKCFQKHIQPEKAQVVDDRHLRSEEDTEGTINVCTH